MTRQAEIAAYRCVVCGIADGDHYRKTMLDDIYQLGWRQAAAAFEAWPQLPLFLERSVKIQ